MSKSTKISHKVGRVSHLRKPEAMSLENWQLTLRRQFGQDNAFEVKNIGTTQVYSDFSVYNAATGNKYKVAIRSADASLNFCTCNDFKTNGLGTCKHIEYVLYQIRNYPPYFKILKEGYSPSYSSVYLKYGKERHVKIRLGSTERKKFEQLANTYFDEQYCLKAEAYGVIENLVKEAKAIDSEFRFYEDAMEFVLERRETEQRHQRLQDVFSKGINSPILDTLVNVSLFPYQKEGVQFLAKAGRALLADDMGLGKTIQSIAACELYVKEFKVSKILIVCPTSLKYQWKSEIQKFTSNTVTVIEGDAKQRKASYQQDESIYKIASYHTVENDLESLQEFEPDLIILDEAQRIKNWQSKISASVKKLKSRYAFVLTGTPLENKLEELYSIMQFIDLYKLGPLYHFMANHQVKDKEGKIKGFKNLNKIGELLHGTMLRRTKKEVLPQLPVRMDHTVFVDMTSEQMTLHSEYMMVVAKLVNKWKRFGFLDEKDRQRLLIHLNLMRMVCDSTFVVDQETRFGNKVNELMCILDEALQDTEQKVVVFSQWERMTRLVARELEARGIQFEYLHGGIPAKNREKLLDNFKNLPNSKVFLSTDAGGVGLNLQSASMMINLDIPWNPAVLEQRVGRIYRLGQKRNIRIVNLVSAGTIEHRMLDVLNVKKTIASGVLDRGEDTIFLPENKFNQFMKTVEQMSAANLNFISNASNGSEEIVSYTSLKESSKSTSKAPKQLSFFGDDDVMHAPKLQKKATDSADNLFAEGIQLLNKLSTVLSDKEETQKLVNSIVERDVSTGKKYLKVPIENEQVVENVLKLFGSLMNQGNPKKGE